MCNHERTEADTKVFRLTTDDEVSWRLEVRLKCLDCFTPFLFITDKAGFLNDRPTTGFNKAELRVPLIAPNPEKNN